MKFQNLSKFKNNKTKIKPNFLISNTYKVFNFFTKVFVQVFILKYFDLRYDIQIETYTLSYAIKKVLN